MMEALWEDLSQNEETSASPDWHRQALEETERGLQAGTQTLVDWQTTKEQLRTIEQN